MAECSTCNIDDCIRSIYTTTSSLNILIQNIRSVKRNITGLSILMSRSKIDWDVIVLTECWISNNQFIPIIDGYKSAFTTNNKTQNEGVIVYYKLSHSFSITEPTIEDANCLIIKLNTQTVLLGIYRPPSTRNISKFLDSLNNILLNLKHYKNIFLTGDINIDISSSTPDSRTEHYLNLLASHGLLPAHYIPTHTLTCLDHVIAKTKLSVKCLVAYTTLTDHYSVILSLLTTPASHQRKETIKRIDYNALDVKISNIDFNCIYLLDNPNDATCCFLNTLNSAVSSSSKIINVSRRKRIIKPWITPGLMRCMRNRDNLHLKSKKHPKDTNAKIIYKRYRNFCNDILKKVKQEYDRTELAKCEGNTKKLWNTIKTITSTTKVNTSPVELIDTKNPIKSINDINTFFVCIGKSLADNILRPNSDHITNQTSFQPCLSSLVLLPTDGHEIMTIISGLKPSSSMRCDDIPSNVIKRYAKQLSEPIAHICNRCLYTGEFPNSLKKSLIHPIHKSGSRDCVNNYRPISILPTLSKILEKVINKQLIKYLESNKLLSDNQYGFRRGRSTYDAVNQLTDKIVNKLEERKKVITIFLDLAKAFDTVSAPLLLNKLEHLGIRGTQLKLFHSYLNGRVQRVVVDKWISDDCAVNIGVPQGSVLGPTLFLIFINDLCKISLSNGRIYTFADDTALLFYGNTWEEVYNYAQMGFTKVTNWLYNNLLTLNTEKTKYITFSPANSHQTNITSLNITHHSCNHTHASCSCPNIQKVDSIKYLGIIIDKNLNFNAHIELLAKRIRKLIYIFKNLRHVADAKVIKSVYFALCQSVLTYCITAWGGSHKTSMIKVERAQRAILKTAYSLPFLYPTDKLYEKCKVLTVRQLFILHTVLRKHSSQTYNPNLNTHKRIKAKVCTTKLCRYGLSHRHHIFLGSYLYNKINSILNVYPMTKLKCKQTLTSYLLTCNYDDTEELLTVPK